jgi:hypothetical protein
MATPLGWSQGGSGSVCLAFDQLRDVIESQEELIHQLRNVVGRQKSSGEAKPQASRVGRSQALFGCEGCGQNPCRERHREEAGLG